MNTSRLREIVEQLLQADRETNFQRLFSDVQSQLASLSGQPNSSAHQNNYANAMENLRGAFRQMQARFDPAQIKRFQQIGAYPYFVSDIPNDITTKIAENPATLSVVQEYVTQLFNDRQKFLTTLEDLRERLERLGVTVSGLQPGEAEIGFTIPRQLFEDQLDGLIGELREVRFIIRTFSETVTGSVEEIFVKQISTTDPLFFFGVSASTILAIGKAVQWVLEAVSERWRNVGWVIALGVIPTGCRDRVGDGTRCGPRPPVRSIGAKGCVFPAT